MELETTPKLICHRVTAIADHIPLSAISSFTGVASAFMAIMLWSTNAPAAKLALSELGVIQVLALQFGGASATLALSRLWRSSRARESRVHKRRPSLHFSDVFAGIFFVGVVGLLGTISLQYLAFATAPIVEANVVAYGWPLITALWVAATYRTKLALTTVPLAIVGFSGAALMLVSGNPAGTSEGVTAGYVAALASAGCMVVYTIMSADSPIPVDSLILPATTLGAVLAVMLCVAGAAPWEWESVSMEAWGAAIYAGVGPMAGGFWLWTRAMTGDGATQLAPLGYATPLLSTMLLLLVGETLTFSSSIGALLILISSVGVLVVQRKEHG